MRIHNKAEEDRNRLEVELQELDNRKEEQKKNLEKQIEDEKKRADARVSERLAKAKQTPKKASQSLSGVEQWRPLVSKYDWPVEEALLVMKLESGGNARAVSRTDDHGLYQIHGGYATHGEKIYDPEFNISLAYNHYYKNRRWRPWYAVRGILWG